MHWSTIIVLGLVISFLFVTCKESAPDVALISVVNVLPTVPLDSTLPAQLRYADSLILWRDYEKASTSITQYLTSEADAPLYLINRAKNLWCYAVLRSDTTGDPKEVLKVLGTLNTTHSAEDTLMAGERAMNLGLYYQKKEDLEKSATYFDEALKYLTSFYGPQHSSMQRHYRDIGSIYYFDLGRVQDAFDLFAKEEILHQQWRYPPREQMLNAYNLGVIYRDLEEFDLAEKYQHQAIAAIRGTALMDSRHAILPYSSLCYLYAHQNDAERLHQYVDTTLGLVRTHFKTDTVNFIDYFTTLALCYIPGNVNDPIRGITILNEVPFAAAQLAKYRGAFAEVYRTGAYLKLGQGNLGSAQESMRKAIALYESISKLNEYYTAGYADALLGLGSFYLEDGKQVDKAMPHIHHAAILGLRQPLEEFAETYPERYLKYYSRWYDFLVAYGDQILYDDIAPDVLDRMMALSTRIDDALSSTRQKVSNHDVLRNAELNHDMYTYMIGWCYELLQKFEQDTIMHHAFDHIEKSRAHLLLSQLSSTNLAKASGVPEAVIDEGVNLTREELVTAAYLDYAGMDSLLARKHKYFQRLEKQYPEYYEKSYRPERATLTQVQSAMHDDEAMICYQLKDSQLYSLIITTDTTVLLRTHFDALCHESVEHLYTAVSVRPPNDWYTTEVEYLSFAKTAFQCALKDAFSLIHEKNRWWIAADGVLELLPFEILIAHSDSTDQSFADIPYLVKSYDIGYVLSATTWYHETQKVDPVITRVVAFIHSEGIHTVRSSEILRDVSQFQGMPGTAKAAAAIRKIYGSENVSIYENSKATTAAFRSALNTYDAFHLGLHAFADTTVRQQHGIVFPGDNAVLTVPEIVGSEIDATLVFLEGCETGVGKQARGEGILNFARPFIAAGTRHVLATRWKLHDQTAGLMSGYFYQQLKAHGDISRANSEAKRMFLHQAKRIQSHPYYWAAVMSVQ